MDLGQVLCDVCPTGQKDHEESGGGRRVGESCKEAPRAGYVVWHEFCAHDQKDQREDES